MKTLLKLSTVLALVLLAQESFGQWQLLRLLVRSRTSNRIASVYRIPPSTLRRTPGLPPRGPYTQVGSASSYDANLSSYMRRNGMERSHIPYSNFLEYQRMGSTLSAEADHLGSFSRSRVSEAQAYLKEKGYYAGNINGQWDDASQQALIKRHTELKKELVDAASPEAKTSILEDFNRYIPEELLSRAYNENKEYARLVSEHYTQQIIAMQDNLEKLGYYRAGVDGVYGSKSRQALREFEKDFSLQRMPYEFHYRSNKTLAHVELEDGDDFLRLWVRRKEKLARECSPSLCLSQDQIAISLQCGNVTLGFTTKGEVSISAKGRNRTYEHTFNAATPAESTGCSISWKVCIEAVPSGTFTICDVTVAATALQNYGLSAKSNGQEFKIL